MLVNLRSIRKVISYGGCVVQLFMFLALGATECVLLPVMSFDSRIIKVDFSVCPGPILDTLAASCMNPLMEWNLHPKRKEGNMWSQVIEKDNGSSFEGFILVGFSDRPRLELVLFVVVLSFYLLTLLGNVTIILLSALDSRLHTPMYFFLANLSFLDMCFTTGSIPQMLYNLWGPDKTISYVGCAI
ncbi:hypothetical protein STEG23_026775 [Scotinomys teguina]